MDNELQELEAELKRLRPVAPARKLAAAIGRDLAARPRRNHWAWAALPLAAAVAALLFLRTSPAPVAAPAKPEAAPVAVTAPAATEPEYKPVSADKLLYAQSDDGLVTLADGTTARRYRSSYVDTITWKDPRTQASMRWSMPRTEVSVIPVSFQ